MIEELHDTEYGMREFIIRDPNGFWITFGQNGQGQCFADHTFPMTDTLAARLPVRAAAPDDAAEIGRLLTLLGHPTEPQAVASWWDEWAAAGNTALVAVRADGTLAGLATLHQMLVLHRPHPVGRITALVVDTPDRGQGLGRSLVAAAEVVLAATGCGLLEVTSNVRREDAHAFYEHLGYERTSLRFARVLTTAR